MAASFKSATILEHCRVPPPPYGGDVAAEQRLPLTFFDVIWVHFHPIQRLLFYNFPCSKTHFLQTIVPSFKSSLSQTLKHFLPLAGNLIYPLNSGMPELRYLPGDSVSVTVAESNEGHDFDYLTGNHPRVADEFYSFFSDLPAPEKEGESVIIPLLAVQITLFSGAGICVGINNSHAVGDASSIVGFIKAWSSIAKLGEFPVLTQSLPMYDRSVVKDPSGLINSFWNSFKHLKIKSSSSLLNLPTNKFRATYILRKNDIQKLRNSIQAKKLDLLHLSSFTITAAYVWSCLAKSSAEEEVADGQNEPEYFAFAVDVRGRTDPPIPADYFGNCVGMAVVESTHADLKGEDGFLTAVELIGNLIGKKVNNKDEILADADKWLSNYEKMVGKRLFGVAGSPKFYLYDSDFGWGTPKKYEAIAIDGDGSMSLCKSREFEGGLEIGLSLPRKKMDDFAAVYYLGLNI
ncbi:hypothetical protein ACP275_02G167300 [Erythranthe tilingii]